MKIKQDGEFTEVTAYTGKCWVYPEVADETMTHERLVRQALSEGKPVPANVLKDYPNLAH